MIEREQILRFRGWAGALAERRSDVTLARRPHIVAGRVVVPGMTTMTRLSDLTGDYVLDSTRTRIGFIARHTMATKVRGQFDAVAGHAHLDGDDPAMSTVDLRIGAKSIQTGNRRRDAPLRGKFLDVDRYPAITFSSSKVERLGETRFGVTGDLTVRGVTRPVTVGVELTGVENTPTGSARVSFTGSATINRKDWGVRWNAAIGLVSKAVDLRFDVVVVAS